MYKVSETVLPIYINGQCPIIKTCSGVTLNLSSKDSTMRPFIIVLFDLILYVPSTIFKLNRDGSSWVEPVLSLDNCVLLKDHNAVTPVRLEPAALRSRVKHSTTEPLRSLTVYYVCEHPKEKKYQSNSGNLEI